MLIEQPFPTDLEDIIVPDEVLRFAAEGIKRGKAIDCFDFVPSDPSHLYRALSVLNKSHICEWGSGVGVVTGMARMLGHQATGIEIHEELAKESRRLLSDFDLDCQIHHGSYFELDVNADYYFVYCWPGQMNRVEERFASGTPLNAKLLVCHGAEDVRLKVKDKAPS